MPKRLLIGSTLCRSTVKKTKSQKRVLSYSKVHKRFEPDIIARLDAAETHYSRKHVFAGIVFLEQVCSKTSIPENPALQSNLLLWCVEGLLVMMLRKDIKPDIGRETAINKLVPKMLLMRRIVMWLGSRFRYAKDPEFLYREGYDPTMVMNTLFSSWASYHKHFPKGKIMELDAKPEEQDMAFLSKLPESQRHLIELR